MLCQVYPFFLIALSFVDRVTIGTYNFVLLISNAVTPATLGITQFFVQFNSRRILQLINDISNDLKKLDNYFCGTTIFAFSNAPVAFGAPKRLLKDVELFVVTALGIPAAVISCSSLLNCHKLPEESA